MESDTTGERKLQTEMGSSDRAQRFYNRQMRTSLNSRMIALIKQQDMVFIATADARRNCDCTPRFGNSGFVLVVNPTTLAYPEYRGNGVYASLGNILEGPHIGLVFLDFFHSTVGLHVNGQAHSYTIGNVPSSLIAFIQRTDPPLSNRIERWVVVAVEEAYIHCSKHVPLLQKLDKPINWGTDDPISKSNNFFIESD